MAFTRLILVVIIEPRSGAHNRCLNLRSRFQHTVSLCPKGRDFNNCPTSHLTSCSRLFLHDISPVGHCVFSPQNCVHPRLWTSAALSITPVLSHFLSHVKLVTGPSGPPRIFNLNNCRWWSWYDGGGTAHLIFAHYKNSTPFIAFSSFSDLPF